MLRQGGALLAVVSVLGLVPPVACATVSVSKLADGIYVTGSDADEQLGVTADESDFYVFGTGLTAGMNCTGSSTTVKCSKTSVASVHLSMGGGNDDWTNTTGYPTLADGGAGNDKVYGSNQSDMLYGSGGDDRIYPRGGSDTVEGGAGVDVVDYSDLTDVVDQRAAVRVSLDDQANDGVDNAGTNIHSDIENVVGSIGPDQISGSAAANQLAGGAGNDTISAEDSVADGVDCGEGSDVALVDKLDTVIACEAVQGSGASAGEPPPTSGTETPADPISPDPQAGPSPSGVPAAITASIAARWRSRLRTLVLRLVVKAAPAPASIRVTCSGRKKGCPFKSKTVAPKAADTSLTKLFKRAKLRPGALLEIRVTSPGAIGKVFRFTIRKMKKPKAQTLCLAPGATKPGTCA